jgi:hypothetical protein
MAKFKHSQPIVSTINIQNIPKETPQQSNLAMGSDKDGRAMPIEVTGGGVATWGGIG